MDDLIKALKAFAKANYGPDYQPITKLVENVEFDVFEDSMLGEENSHEKAPFIRQELAARGLSSFDFYRRGTSATVLAARHTSGKIACVRIPDEKFEPKEHIRQRGPTLQALDTFKDEGGYPIDIMPLGPVWGGKFNQFDKGSPTAMFEGFEFLEADLPKLEEMYDVLGYEVDRMKDVFVLPNGVPVFVDPDICEPTHYTVPDAEVHAALMEHYGDEEGALMCQLAWVNADGSLKQHEFFGADYLTRPVQKPRVRRAGPEPI